jgi:protein gp37
MNQSNIQLHSLKHSETNVPFFFKQWGGVQKKRAGRTLEGRTWDEMPLRLGMLKA